MSQVTRLIGMDREDTLFFYFNPTYDRISDNQDEDFVLVKGLPEEISITEKNFLARRLEIQDIQLLQCLHNQQYLFRRFVMLVHGSVESRSPNYYHVKVHLPGNSPFEYSYGAAHSVGITYDGKDEDALAGIIRRNVMGVIKTVTTQQHDLLANLRNVKDLIGL